MKVFIGLFFIVLSSLIFGQQNNHSAIFEPDYVYEETRVLNKSNSAFSSLFEPNNDADDKRPFFIQLMDVVYDTENRYFYYELSRKWGDSVYYKPFNARKVDILYAKYFVFYKNGEEISHHLSELTIFELIDYKDEIEPHYLNVFSLNDERGQLEYFLRLHNVPSKSDYSYWDFFNDNYSYSELFEKSFASLNYVETNSNLNVWDGLEYNTKRFKYPNRLSKDAEIRVEYVHNEVKNTQMASYLEENSINAGSTCFSNFMSQCKNYSNIPLFYPYSFVEEYSSIHFFIRDGARRENLDYYYFNDSLFFNKKMDCSLAEKLVLDTITRDTVYMDSLATIKAFGEKFIPKDTMEIYHVTKNKEITSYFILTVKDGNITFPIAMAPITYDLENGDHSNALFWVPIDENFQKLLYQSEAYSPGHAGISNGEYLFGQINIGDIVSSRKIDNAEWQEMLKELK